MDKSAQRYLEELTQTPSPSGYEQPIQKVIQKRVESCSETFEVDVHGNIIVGVNVGKSPRVMLSGHCDEIGFMITHISDEGFLYFSPIGGVDPLLMPGLRVVIYAQKGVIPGVIGKKPIHLMTAEDKQKKARWTELWIDIGAKDAKDAKKDVRIGDPVTFEGTFLHMKNDIVVSRGFDDKIGTFVVTELLTRIDPKKINCALFSVATVQEEIGLRGAKTSSFRINPDIGIAVDIGFSSDFPEGEKKAYGDIQLGKGPMLSRGANINQKLGSLLEKTAQKNKIPFQVTAAPRATGTDANAMQVNRQGVATALISIPTRYGHTPVELLCLEDVENAIKLLQCFLESLKPDQSFIPG